MTIISRSLIMKTAWAAAKSAAVRFGGRAREFFSAALRDAWHAARGPLWTVVQGSYADAVISHHVVDGVLVVVQKGGRYPKLVRRDGAESGKVARVEVGVYGWTIQDVTGVRHEYNHYNVYAYNDAGQGRAIHEGWKLRKQPVRPLADLVSEALVIADNAVSVISEIGQEHAAASAILIEIDDDASSEPMTRDRYETLAAKWSFDASPDAKLSTWGDFRWPEQSIETMPRLLIDQRRAFVVEREKIAAEDNALREASERRMREQDDLSERPVKRTYTRRVADFGPSFIRNGELHTVIEDHRIGTVSEDDPSVLGSHLLGYEGSPLYEITVEVRG